MTNFKKFVKDLFATAFIASLFYVPSISASFPNREAFDIELQATLDSLDPIVAYYSENPKSLSFDFLTTGMDVFRKLYPSIENTTWIRLIDSPFFIASYEGFVQQSISTYIQSQSPRQIDYLSNDRLDKAFASIKDETPEALLLGNQLKKQVLELNLLTPDEYNLVSGHSPKSLGIPVRSFTSFNLFRFITQRCSKDPYLFRSLLENSEFVHLSESEQMVTLFLLCLTELPSFEYNIQDQFKEQLFATIFHGVSLNREMANAAYEWMSDNHLPSQLEHLRTQLNINSVPNYRIRELSYFLTLSGLQILESLRNEASFRLIALSSGGLPKTYSSSSLGSLSGFVAEGKNIVRKIRRSITGQSSTLDANPQGLRSTLASPFSSPSQSPPASRRNSDATDGLGSSCFPSATALLRRGSKVPFEDLGISRNASMTSLFETAGETEDRRRKNREFQFLGALSNAVSQSIELHNSDLHKNKGELIEPSFRNESEHCVPITGLTRSLGTTFSLLEHKVLSSACRLPFVRILFKDPSQNVAPSLNHLEETHRQLSQKLQIALLKKVFRTSTNRIEDLSVRFQFGLLDYSTGLGQLDTPVSDSLFLFGAWSTYAVGQYMSRMMLSQPSSSQVE